MNWGHPLLVGCWMCDWMWRMGSKKSGKVPPLVIGLYVCTPQRISKFKLTRSISMHFFKASPYLPRRWKALAHSVWNHMHCISFKFSIAVTPSRVNFWHISSASETRLARSMYLAHLKVRLYLKVNTKLRTTAVKNLIIGLNELYRNLFTDAETAYYREGYLQLMYRSAVSNDWASSKQATAVSMSPTCWKDKNFLIKQLTWYKHTDVYPN